MHQPIQTFLAEKLSEGKLIAQPQFYLFLLKTLLEAGRLERNENGTPIHYSPAKCLGLLTDKLRHEFGSYASWVLEGWQLKEAIQVGQAIFLLAEGGYLKLQGTETLEDFSKEGIWI